MKELSYKSVTFYTSELYEYLQIKSQLLKTEFQKKS